MRPMPMADAPRYYVSLGDSMSIDDYAGGAGCGAASLLFRNRPDDFPEWSGRDLETVLPHARLVALAHDGAVSAAVRFVQIPRLKEVGVKPAVVTLTMGGNDLLQTFGDDAAAQAAHDALRTHTRATLIALREWAGDIPTIVTTIYDPSDGTGDTSRLGIVAWPAALGWIARYNDTLREAAHDYGALLADAHAHFAGYGLRAGNPAQTDPRPANHNLYFCGVVEPNAWGASALRGLWWETLARAGFLPGAA